MSAAPRLFALALSLSLVGASASAEDADGRVTRLERRSETLLAQLFPRREPAPTPPGPVGDPTELTLRLDRLEAQMRQLTGAIEQLQFRNQQLEAQLRRMQEDV